MPRISAIIPAFNGRSRYLTEAIQSVLAQTYKDFDLIVVDDASTDYTHEIIPNDPKVTYYRRDKNGGQGVARNEGAKRARGEFISFLDQDDLWEATFLEETIQEFFQQNEAALVHTDGYQVDEQNQILEYDGAMKTTNSICQLLRNSHDTATSGSLIKKSVFEKVGGFDERLTIWEDIDLGIRLAQQLPLIHLPKPLYRHRLYGHNASRDIPSERALLARKLFLEKHNPLCQGKPSLRKAMKLDWALFYSDKGKYHLSRNETQEARQAFIQSLKQNPFSLKTLLRYLRSF